MNHRKQSGVVLIVSLLMLLVMSLLAVSAINISSTNLLIVNNMQSQQRAEDLAQAAIEKVISSQSSFDNPEAVTVTVDGEEVQVAAARCLDTRPATGYSAAWNLAPEDTAWQLTASVADSDTGAVAVITQGIKTRMVSGGCI
jgi:Tfp pilus assembly protein PilX